MTERSYPVERIHSGAGPEGQQHTEWTCTGEAGGRLYPTDD